MNDLKHLIPFSKDHSISETIFTLFLKDPIDRPERFKSLKEIAFKDFEVGEKVLNRFQFKVSTSDAKIDIPAGRIDGFLFKKVTDGKIEWLISSSNDPTPFISIHCLKYSQWKQFLEEIKFFVSELGKFEKSFIVKACGLHYVDQFNWISKEAVPIHKIFNWKTEFLPSTIFNSPSNDVWNVLIDQNIIDKEGSIPGNYINRTNIYSRIVTEGNINLAILHNTIKEMDPDIHLTDLLKKNGRFDELLTWGHVRNKEVLKNLFTQEVLDLIKLK